MSSRFQFVFNYKHIHAHLFCVMHTTFSSPVQLLTEEKERLVKRKEATKISEWSSSYMSQQSTRTKLETEALLLRILSLILYLS